jgi:hypothetical protein
MIDKKVTKPDDILHHIKAWSDRKKTMFNNTKFIEKAVEHINLYFA